MKESKTNRGFKIIEFVDQKGLTCSIQESSLHYPCVWIGVNDTPPLIMASQAHKHGINTNQTTGWVEYPIPEEVLMHNRMHLDKPMLRALIDTLENYYTEMPDWVEEEE